MASSFFYTLVLLAVIAGAVLANPIDTSRDILSVEGQREGILVETVKVEPQKQLTRQARFYGMGYPYGGYGGYGYGGYPGFGGGMSSASASASASASSGGMGFYGK